jgi:hypothetical protein
MLWRTGVRVNELLNIKPINIETRNRVVNFPNFEAGAKKATLDYDHTS